MAVVPRGDEAERGLTQVKGVDAAYPLYGAVVLDPPMTAGRGLRGAGRSARRGDGPDPDRPAWPGGRRHVPAGHAGLRPRAADPARARRGRGRLRPRPAHDGADGGPGGVGASAARARSSTASTACAAAREPTSTRSAPRRRRLSPPACAGATGATARRACREFVDRLGAFLVLVGLAGLAVGGVGVSAAVRAYLEREDAVDRHAEDAGRRGADDLPDLLRADRRADASGHRARALCSGRVLPLALAPVIEARLPVPAAFGVPSRAAARGGALRRAGGAPLHALAAGADRRRARRGAVPRHAAARAALPRPVWLA